VVGIISPAERAVRPVHMSSEVAISVIISTRNRAHYLPEVLRTLAAQDCDAPFEVIVIDNASTDNTAAVLNEWCRTNSRFRTAREPRPGLSRGKNAGVRMARAPLLLFTDDDMRVDPHWAESYYDLFARRKDALMLAGGTIVPIPHDLGRWPDWLDEPALADAGLLHHREERVLRESEYVFGGNMAVPRCLFDRFGLWEETVGLQGDERVTLQDSRCFEDTEFQDRIRKAGGSVWFCPPAVVHHRVARHTITPRRISSTAFARGRNDIWIQELPIWHEVRLVPRRSALTCLLALGGNLFRWALCVILFRLSERKSFLQRARGAAFASGRWLDSLRAGRTSMRLFLGAGRVAFPARSLLLRLTPDVP